MSWQLLYMTSFLPKTILPERRQGDGRCAMGDPAPPTHSFCQTTEPYFSSLTTIVSDLGPMNSAHGNSK